jgi:hypothetical protein
MPETWQDEQSLQQYRAKDFARLGTEHDQTRFCRVLRASTKPATDFTEYYDMLLLTNEYEDIDLNADAKYELAKPVRPMLLTVAAPLGSDLEVDSVVTVRIARATWAQWKGEGIEELGTGYDYDAFPLCHGRHSSISGSGGPVMGFFFQGWRDPSGFAGMIAD